MNRPTLSLILLIGGALVTACGSEHDRAAPPDSDGHGPIAPPAAADTSTATTETSTIDEGGALTDDGWAVCEHIYDCGLVIEDGGTVWTREQCPSFDSSGLPADQYRCVTMASCADLRACLGVPEPQEEPPPPARNDAFARALAVSPVWSGIGCVIDGESAYDARCLTASLRPSYGVRFEPNGDFEINIITGTSGDHDQERGAEGHLAAGCQTVDVTQCGQASYGLPISFDGTYLRIGSIWVLEALPEQYDREPRNLCR